ncbi:hypothetical protein BU14_0151s0010, partial [Porphyra umbilicalis]
LSTLSRVARGEATSALLAPPPAVQAGAAAVALRGLLTLAAVGIDDGATLEARRVARNSEPGTPACVVFRLDQTRTELSPVFHAKGHQLQLKVQLQGEANLDLDMFLWHFSHPASGSTVDATVMMWAQAVDGGRRVRLTEGEEGPEAWAVKREFVGHPRHCRQAGRVAAEEDDQIHFGDERRERRRHARAGGHAKGAPTVRWDAHRRAAAARRPVVVGARLPAAVAAAGAAGAPAPVAASSPRLRSGTNANGSRHAAGSKHATA